jgi:hypothetical protein
MPTMRRPCTPLRASSRACEHVLPRPCLLAPRPSPPSPRPSARFRVCQHAPYGLLDRAAWLAQNRDEKGAMDCSERFHELRRPLLLGRAAFNA